MWAVTFTYNEQADEDTLLAWGDQLEDKDGSVAAIPGYGFTVTVHETGPDPLKAITNVRDTVAIIPLSPVGIETVDEETYEAAAFAPTVPEIVSAVEAADILGVSRQRVHQLHRENPRFPAPLYELRTGPLWTRQAIEWFASVWERRPGRPAAARS